MPSLAFLPFPYCALSFCLCASLDQKAGITTIDRVSRHSQELRIKNGKADHDQARVSRS